MQHNKSDLHKLIEGRVLESNLFSISCYHLTPPGISQDLTDHHFTFQFVHFNLFPMGPCVSTFSS